jgi:hypothetical protein
MGILAVEFDDATGTLGVPRLAAETRDRAASAHSRSKIARRAHCAS